MKNGWLTMDCTENIEVYNIVCDSLKLTPNPNNGTLRLPLNTIGVHTSETSPPEPADPVPSDTIISIDPIESSSAADDTLKAPTMVGVDQPDASPDRPAVHDDNSDKDEDQSTKEKIGDEAAKFWEYITGKLNDWKAWAAGLVGDKEADGTETANIKGKEGE